MSAPSSPESACSTSASISPASNTPGSASRTPGAENASNSAGPESPSSLTYEQSTALRLASIFSSEASPAEEQAPPAAERAWTIRKLLCGGRWPESLASYDPDTCCWRTSRTSLLSEEGELGERFWGTWPRSGMSLLGTVFPLPPLAPRTSVTGSSRSPLLPTPIKRDGSNRGTARGAGSVERGGQPSLAQVLLPTPRARVDKEHSADGKHWGELRPTLESLLADASGSGSTTEDSAPAATPTLMTPEGSTPNRETEATDSKTALLPTPHGFAKEGQKRRPGPSRNELGVALRKTLLPTPTAGDAKQSRNKTSGRKDGSKHHSGTTLTDFAYEQAGASTPEQSSDGKKSPAPLLNPCFVEWMMGLPEGWSDPDCPRSATEFKSRLESSSGGDFSDLSGSA